MITLYNICNNSDSCVYKWSDNLIKDLVSNLFDLTYTFILRLIGERHGFIYCVETEKMLKQWVPISVGMFQNVIWNGTNKLLPKRHFYYTGKDFEIKVVKQLSKIEGVNKNWIICWEKFWKSSHLSLLKGWLAITSV